MNKSKYAHNLDQNLKPKIGYWTYNKSTDQFNWSQEVCNMLEWPLQISYHNLEKFSHILHEQDRNILITGINKLYEHHTKNYKHQIRIKSFNNPNEYFWYNLIIHANKHMIFGFIINIHKHKNLEKQREQLQSKLLKFTQQAGLSEAALSVIHNISNILNGITTSISILKNRSPKNNYENFLKIINLLQENRTSLQNFLTSDPRGSKIPEYIMALGEVMYDDYQKFMLEINNIFDKIEKITQIIQAQETITTSCSLNQKVLIPELFEEVITLFANTIIPQNIIINQHYTNLEPIFLDKPKLKQILINLFKNALDAVTIINQSNKIIDLYIEKPTKSLIKIIIQDNGIGIPKENLNKICSFGFTTKPDGNGLGLYNSLLKAKEIGGSLQAISDGINAGSKFILTLPINFAKLKTDH